MVQAKVKHANTSERRGEFPKDWWEKDPEEERAAAR